MAVELEVVDVRVRSLESSGSSQGNRVVLRQLHNVIDVRGADGSTDNLNGGNTGTRVLARDLRYVAVPGGVNIAGEEDNVVVALLTHDVDQLTTLSSVAIPLIQVVRQAVLRQAQQLSDSVSGLRIQRRNQHWSEHDGVAHDTPLCARGTPLAEQVIELLRAEHGATLIIGLASADELQLLVTVGAQVQHGQVGEIAETEAAVELAALGEGDSANRQPLQVSLDSGVAAGNVVAFGLRVVVLSATVPIIVGDLVVIPGHNPRLCAVSFLQVRIGAVGGVAQAVVSERNNLVSRLVVTNRALAGVATGLVLVDVVTDTHNDVDAVIFRHIAVSGEEATFPVSAGGQRDAQVIWRGVHRRRSASLANRGNLARVITSGDGKAVEVVGISGETLDIDLDGVVSIRVGVQGTRGNDVAEALIRSDFPLQCNRAALVCTCGVARVRCHTSPDKNGVRQWIARGHTVLEDLKTTRTASIS